MADVLKRPQSAEVDDYRAYKIISTEHRDRAKRAEASAPNVDGTGDVSPRLRYRWGLGVPSEVWGEDIVDEVVRAQHAFNMSRLSLSIWLDEVE
jgi:hypothetical protein